MKRSGFTLIELSIGMLMTGLIATAIVAFTSAVTTQWHDGNSTEMLDVSAQQAQGIIDPTVQSARAIGGVFSSPKPAVFLWQFDSLNGADQKPQLAEMSLLEYDPSTYTIFYYQADQTKDLANTVSAMQAVSASDMQNASVVSLFKSQSWLKTTRAILGPGRIVNAAIEIGRVTAASFQSITTSGSRQLSWNATLARGATSKSISGLITVRAPMDVP